MPKSSHRFAVLSLVGINVMIIVAASFMVPLWATYTHRLGGDLRTAGNAIGVFSIVIGLMTIILASIGNKLQKERFFLVFAQFVMTAFYCTYFWIQHPWQLYLVQIGLAIGGAMQAPAIYSLYHRYIPDKKSTSYWGFWVGFYNIAVGVGAMASAYVVHRFGMNTMFSCLVALSLVNCFYSLWFAMKSRESKGGSGVKTDQQAVLSIKNN